MSIGIALFRKLLLDKVSLSVVSESGLEESDFIEKEIKVYHFIVDHFQKFGQLPSIVTVEEETGVEIPKFPGEPVEYWIEKLVHRSRQQVIIKEGRKALSEAEDGEVTDAMASLRGLIFDLDRKFDQSGVVKLHDAMSMAMDAHEKRKMTPDLLGIPFGIPFLDKTSDGAQGSDTVAVVGRPGTGKTYLILYMALAAVDKGKKVLFYSPEMGVPQLGRRLLALNSHVPVNMIKFGQVGFYAEEKIKQDIADMMAKSGDRFNIIRGSMTSTVEDLAIKTKEMKPDILYVDGAYLLRPRSKVRAKWERVAETAEVLKALSAEMDIPILGTYQFNRKGAGKLENIAYSDVIGQLASIVISLFPDPNVAKGEAWDGTQSKILELIKGRDGEHGSAKLLFDLVRMNVIQEEEVNEER